MSDWVKVPEADWRVLSSMKGVLFRRLQEKSLGELLEILLRQGNDPGETLAEVSKQARWIEVRAQRVCGKLTRHGCRAQFASMLRLGLFRTEEIEAFTEKTRRWAGVVLGGEEDAPAESPAEPPLPVAQNRTADEGKFNGYITPDGECVQLEDLAGMERALTRLFGGDLGRVLQGLREVAVELAKERDDAAVRRFLARALEIGGGAADDGRAEYYLAMLEQKREARAGASALGRAN